MLGLKYEDISWDFGKPSVMDDPECMPCVFLQVRFEYSPKKSVLNAFFLI